MRIWDGILSAGEKTIMMNAITICVMLLAIMALGLIAVRTRMVQKEFAAPLARITLNILAPAAVLDSMCKVTHSASLGDDLTVLLMSVGILVLCAAVAGVACLLCRDAAERPLIFVGVAFMNAGVIGLPVTQAVYGAEGLRYAGILLVPLSLLCAVLSPVIIRQQTADSRARAVGKALCSPISLSAVAGLAIYLSGWTLPSCITELFGTLGAAALPMGMLLCGITIGGVQIRHMQKPLSGLLYALCRNVVCPLLVYALLRLCGVSGLLLKVAVLFAAMPVPLTLILLSCQDSKLGERASVMTFFSVLLSGMTIPGWLIVTDLFS